MAAAAVGTSTAGARLHAPSQASGSGPDTKATGWLTPRDLALARRSGRGPRRHLAGRAHRLEEGHQGVDLGGREVLAVGRHVPAALEHLADEPVGPHPPP